jgi:hypothetical protein
MGRAQKRTEVIAYPATSTDTGNAEVTQSSLTSAFIAPLCRRARDTGQELAPATRRPATHAARQRHDGSVALDGRHHVLFTHPGVTEVMLHWTIMQMNK